MSNKLDDYVIPQLERYQHGAEQWEVDYNEAQACYDFEDFLEVGIEIFESINRYDEAWRMRVHKGDILYSEEMETAIENVYRDWLVPCEAIESVLQMFEGSFGKLKHAEAFRSRHAEAKGILTPDGKFFTGRAMVDLRDSAIDKHQQGETEDVGGSW